MVPASTLIVHVGGRTVYTCMHIHVLQCRRRIYGKIVRVCVSVPAVTACSDGCNSSTSKIASSHIFISTFTSYYASRCSRTRNTVKLTVCVCVYSSSTVAMQ